MALATDQRSRMMPRMERPNENLMNDRLEDSSIVLTDLVDDGPPTDGLIAGLDKREAKLLFDAGQRLVFKKGSHVFRQGDPHTGIFIIDTGVVRSYYVAPNGREFTFAHWSAGNFVGGPELFGCGQHLWSSVARTHVSVHAISGRDLRELAREIPTLAINLLDGLAGKARYYSLVLQMLGTRSVVERLAYLLWTTSVDEHGEDGKLIRKVSFRISHADMATIVGSTRQWVSSTLDRFRRSGMIDFDHNQHIVIHDLSRLKEIAES